MIKAVIFDCYGVLTSDGWHPFKYKYFSDNKEKFAEATSLNVLTNAGKISYNDFLKRIGEMTGLQSEEVRLEMESNTANLQLFDYINSELASQYRLAILSNVAGDWLGELFSPEQLEIFDYHALSFKLGVTKPNPEIYTKTAKELGVEIDECVFIDDIESYAQGAKTVGMQAIVYRDFEQMKAELEDILSVSNTDK